MFRLLGFLVGSAASIGAILLLLGMPEFRMSNPELDKGRFDEALDLLREKKVDAELVARSVADKLADTIEDVAEQEEAALQAAPATESEARQDEFAATTGADHPSIAADELQQIVPVVRDMQWHSFWNPFRSEIAAKGFVSQLEKVTGLDYRIVKVETGVYQVAFAYDDDGERLSKLTQITAATGLELPGK